MSQRHPQQRNYDWNPGLSTVRVLFFKHILPVVRNLQPQFSFALSLPRTSPTLTSVSRLKHHVHMDAGSCFLNPATEGVSGRKASGVSLTVQTRGQCSLTRSSAQHQMPKPLALNLGESFLRGGHGHDSPRLGTSVVLQDAVEVSNLVGWWSV